MMLENRADPPVRGAVRLAGRGDKAHLDSPQIARLLAELDADPERLSRVQRSNVRNAALRHDSVYRVREVFEALRLPTAEVLAREERLRALAGLAATPGVSRYSGSSDPPRRAATAPTDCASRG